MRAPRDWLQPTRVTEQSFRPPKPLQPGSGPLRELGSRRLTVRSFRDLVIASRNLDGFPENSGIHRRQSGAALVCPLLRTTPTVRSTAGLQSSTWTAALPIVRDDSIEISPPARQ